jgi:hypothetical protein
MICPHCRQLVTLADSAAGRPTPCPSCGNIITPPALTGSAIDAAPDPPPTDTLTPPPPANPPAAGPAAVGPSARRRQPPVEAPAAYSTGSTERPWLRLALRREAAHWLAPGALLAALLLSFFTWAAVAPNGTRVYTQNAWQAASGSFSADPLGERVMQAEDDLKTHSGWSVGLLFFLILLIPTTAIAVADRVLARNPAAIPDVFRPIWPHRQMIIAGLCAALLLLLLLPLVFGFGLESAVQSSAEAAVAQPQPAVGKTEVSTTDKKERDLRRDVKVAGYGLTRTLWLDLAVLAMVLALVGAGLAIWLDRHPKAPDPRMEVYC